MKKLLKIALAVVAAFLFIVPAGAETYYLAVALDGGVIKVMGSNGVTYTLEGKEVVGVGVNDKGVWTLVRTTDVPGRWFDGREDTHMIGWGEHVLYLNDRVYKKYPYGDPNTCCISSAALKVRDKYVVVAGTYAKRWKDTNFFSGKLWGEVNGRMMYGDDPENSKGWVRMSLKRKWFQGLAEPSRGLLNVGYANTPDVDGSFSSVYHVYACDYCFGNIYTAGWGEREYTYYNAGLAQDVYYVRRCARAWVDGQLCLEQYENQTSSAHTITAAGSRQWHVLYTAGHHRGHPMMWNDKLKVEDALREPDGVITAEAVVNYNNTTRRYFILDKALYCYEIDRSHKITYDVYDVVAYKDQIYCVELGQIERTGEIAAVVDNIALDWTTVNEVHAFSLKGLWFKDFKLAVGD